MADLRGSILLRSPSGLVVHQIFIRGILAVLSPLSNSLHPWRNPPEFFAFGFAGSSNSLCSGGIPFARSHPSFSETRVGFSFMGCLTLRSTRTPPAFPFALSQLFAISASFIVSVQAGPVSFIR